jgi:hypothetical protein
MEREEPVVELGAASIETKGPLNGVGDLVIGRPQAGLTDD